MKVHIIDTDENLLMEEETPVRFPQTGDFIVIDNVSYEIVKRAWVYTSNDGNDILLCVGRFDGKIT